MNLTQALADCYRRLGFGTSPGTEVATRLTAFINEVHKETLSHPQMTRLRRRILSFSTVASSPFCVLSQAATKVYHVVDRTNQHILSDMSTSYFPRRQDPGLAFTTATPEGYTVQNYNSAIARQPTATVQLLVDSDSAGDTGTAYIEYVNSSGYIKQASVTMTGTTAVNLGGADVAAGGIIDFYLSVAAVGNVTLVQTVEGGTELARIPPGSTRARFTVLEIWPTPSAAVTLHADVDVFLTDLVNGTDELLIPDEFSEIIVYGVKEREFDKREKYRESAVEERKKVRAVAKLKHHMHHRGSPPSIPTGEFRWSQLGPYYTSGS